MQKTPMFIRVKRPISMGEKMSNRHMTTQHFGRNNAYRLYELEQKIRFERELLKREKIRDQIRPFKPSW